MFFYHLHKNYGCNLQIGGTDQWGHILAGCDLISKKNQSSSVQVGGLTLPLVTTSDGIKFGKSEGNAIWLDSEMTSVFDFFQVIFLDLVKFFRRTSDTVVEKYLKYFTLLTMEEILKLSEQHLVRFIF